jgi:hypothetical protein
MKPFISFIHARVSLMNQFILLHERAHLVEEVIHLAHERVHHAEEAIHRAHERLHHA